MGFQLRRRTKGRNSWFNYSYSKRNGLRGSLSFKIGKDWTVNLGRNGTRTTVNLGNGLRYVSPQRKFGTSAKKQTAAKASTVKSFDSAAFASNLESIADRLEKSKGNVENWTKGQRWAFIIIVTIICVIIQLIMRAFA